MEITRSPSKLRFTGKLLRSPHLKGRAGLVDLLLLQLVVALGAAGEDLPDVLDGVEEGRGRPTSRLYHIRLPSEKQPNLKSQSKGK